MSREEQGGCGVAYLIMLLVYMLGFITFYIIYFDEEPTAIDVYRGKTTLEIIYKDSVAIDSVVVWKEKTK